MKTKDVLELINDTELQKAILFLNQSGRNPATIEAIYQNHIFDTAIDPSADLIAAATNTVFLLNVVMNKTTSAAGTGIPQIEFYAPFNSLTLNRIIGLPVQTFQQWVVIPSAQEFNITSRLRWNDNGATVGVYCIKINGYKITF